MVRRLILGCLAVALIGCGSAAASPAGGPPSAPLARCGPSADRSLAAGRQARVYVGGRALYACAADSSPPVRLAVVSGPCLGSGALGPAAVAKLTVAFAIRTCGVDTDTAAVFVVRLPRGRRLLAAGAVMGRLAAELFERVESIAVSPVGRVAWVGNWVSILGHRGATQVLAAAPGGPVELLGSGRGIVAASLRLRGPQVSWREGGRHRSASYRPRCAPG